MADGPHGQLMFQPPRAQLCARPEHGHGLQSVTPHDGLGLAQADALLHAHHRRGHKLSGRLVRVGLNGYLAENEIPEFRHGTVAHGGGRRVTVPAAAKPGADGPYIHVFHAGTGHHLNFVPHSAQPKKT